MEASAKQVAVRLLARREHSEAEVRRKLEQRDFDSHEIDAAIADLQQGGWQSDERYVEAYIRSRRVKGYGPLRISMELRERGIDEGLASAYLYADDDVWMQTMRQEYAKKFGAKAPADYKEKAKRMRFLQQRGFAPDKIHEVVRVVR